MQKLKSISELAEISKNGRSLGMKVGLITGCFDILHAGHIDLFKFGKRYSDILIVGLDNDKSIKQSKGLKRPINRLRHRALVLDEVSSIDYIFEIKQTFKFEDKYSDEVHSGIVKKIKPDFIFTNPQADSLWKKKQKRAIDNNIKLFLRKTKRLNSSSNIIKLLTNSS